MEKTTLILVICRALQVLFAAVVVGTSVSLRNYLHNFHCVENCGDINSLTTTSGYGIFVGAFGLIDAAVGMVAAFMDIIPYLIMLGVDALTALIYVAGGGALAAYLARPFICNGSGGEHCTEAKADDAFMFLGFLITLVLIGLGFMWRGRKGGKGSYV